MICDWYSTREISSSLNYEDTIFLNDCVKYKGKILFFNDWISANTLYVRQVYDNGVKSYPELKRLVHSHPHFFFQYYALRNALDSVAVSLQSEPFFLLQGKPLSKLSCHNIRCMLLKNESSDAPICQRYWERHFMNSLPKWTDIWQLPFNVLHDARSRELQWKITHHIYATNILLYKMGISQTSNCTECNELDTLIHFFCNCKTTLPVWNHVESKILAFYGERIKIKEHEKLFGYKYNTLKIKYKYANQCRLY